MLELQRAVMLETLLEVIPGGLRASMDWRILSSSATQDDIMTRLGVDTAYFSSCSLWHTKPQTNGQITIAVQLGVLQALP